MPEQIVSTGCLVSVRPCSTTYILYRPGMTVFENRQAVGRQYKPAEARDKAATPSLTNTLPSARIQVT